jgi:hypothetical protein
VRTFATVAFKGSDVVAKAKFDEQLIQNLPIALASGEAEDVFEVVFEVLLDQVVIEQRVVDIDEEHDQMIG